MMSRGPGVFDGGVDLFEFALGLSELFLGQVDPLLVAVFRAGHRSFEFLTGQLEAPCGFVQLLDQLFGNRGHGRVHEGHLVLIRSRQRGFRIGR
jgi:hypothetical protein